MENPIDGIALAGYRSFGPDVQRIGPFNKINLFAGPNNCGKSNILLFLTKHLRTYAGPPDQREKSHVDSQYDPHRNRPTPLTFGRATLRSSERLLSLREKIEEEYRQYFDEILDATEIRHDSPCIWFEYRRGPKPSRTLDVVAFAERLRLETKPWRQMCLAIVPQKQFTNSEAALDALVKVLDPIEWPLPEVASIPAIRGVRDVGGGEWCGKDVEDKLYEHAHPDNLNREMKKIFASVQEFVRAVIGKPEAIVNVPHTKRVEVEMDGRILPLASLGMGIHEVVILAAACTMLTNRIVCIDEPEIHIHPTMQRKLIRYLHDHTSNQYFMATHSAHLLDMHEVAVFRVSLVDGATNVTWAQAADEKSDICADLGYRASDLMQSNCVIWVEGPSDRIYINHWLQSYDSELDEHVHYSVMFYGGRLLFHLSADDPVVKEFISLRRLNRRLVVLIDSDRAKRGERINATKQRICKELGDGDGGFAWVTAGREVENYVPPELIRAAVGDVRPAYEKHVGEGKYVQILPRTVGKAKRKLAFDKVAIARRVAEQPADLAVLDLKQRISELASFIRSANGLDGANEAR